MFSTLRLSITPIWLLFSVLFLFAPFSLATEVTLEDLDRIVTEATDLHDFLKRPDLINRYKEALQSYYGKGSLPDESFDAIIGQLRVMADVPDFAERIWEKDAAKSFFIETSSIASRSLEIGEWKRLVDSNEARNETILAKQGGKTANDRLNAFDAALKRSDSRLADIKKTIVGIPGPRARRKAQAKAYEDFLKTDDFQYVQSYLAQNFWKSEITRELFATKDADVVLDTLKTVEDKPYSLLDHLRVPEEREAKATDVSLEDVKSRARESDVVAIAKRGIPRAGDLLRKHNLFPVDDSLAGKGKRIDFVPLPRRIHAIWRGVPIKECVGGSCQYLNMLTPRRWAAILTKDAQTHQVQVEGEPHGFVETIPGTMKNRTYASVAFGSTLLGKKTKVLDEESGAMVPMSITRLWLQKSLSMKPDHWAGFILSNSNGFRNGGSLYQIKELSLYKMGDYLGSNIHFTFEDPLAHAILDHSERHWPLEGYGESLITDATVEVSQLTLLKDLPDNLEKQITMVKNLLGEMGISDWGNVVVKAIDDENLDYNNLKKHIQGLYDHNDINVRFAANLLGAKLGLPSNPKAPIEVIHNSEGHPAARLAAARYMTDNPSPEALEALTKELNTNDANLKELVSIAYIVNRKALNQPLNSEEMKELLPSLQRLIFHGDFDFTSPEFNRATQYLESFRGELTLEDLEQLRARADGKGFSSGGFIPNYTGIAQMKLGLRLLARVKSNDSETKRLISKVIEKLSPYDQIMTITEVLHYNPTPAVKQLLANELANLPTEYFAYPHITNKESIIPYILKLHKAKELVAIEDHQSIDMRVQSIIAENGNCHELRRFAQPLTQIAP